MTPSDCPKFETCNASVCPLDPGWREAVHLPSERVCRYLIDSGKPGAKEYYANDPTFAACIEHASEVAAKFPAIGRRIQKARGGFRGQHLKKTPEVHGTSASGTNSVLTDGCSDPKAGLSTTETD